MAVAAAAPIVMMVATVAATAVGAMGAMAQGRAQEKAAKYNAYLAMQEGEAAASRSEQETRRKLADAAAAYGASGVTMEGSPLEVMSDLATQGALDKQTILWRARHQSAADLYGGATAAQAGRIGAAGTILTGLGQSGGIAYDTWGTSTDAPKSPIVASSSPNRSVTRY